MISIALAGCTQRNTLTVNNGMHRTPCAPGIEAGLPGEHLNCQLCIVLDGDARMHAPRDFQFFVEGRSSGESMSSTDLVRDTERSCISHRHGAGAAQ